MIDRELVLVTQQRVLKEICSILWDYEKDEEQAKIATYISGVADMANAILKEMEKMRRDDNG